MNSKRVFTFEEIGLALDIFARLLPLADSQQQASNNIKSVVLSMLSNEQISLFDGRENQTKAIKDSIKDYEDFLKSKDERIESNKCKNEPSSKNRFTITDITSMTRDTINVAGSRKQTQKTKSVPPRKLAENDTDQIQLKEVQSYIFKSCDKDPFKPDKYYFSVSENELKAAKPISEILNFKSSPYPRELDFSEAKYSRLFYCSSELVERSAITESITPFDPSSTSMESLDRRKAVLNMAARVLKGCNFLGKKHPAEDSVCTSLVFSDIEEIRGMVFKVNRKTYFRHPTIGTPDILGLHPSSGKMVVIEVKEVQGKVAKTAAAKRQISNYMYLMDVEFGLIVTWGKYVSYREENSAADAVRFPAEAERKSVYLTLIPEMKDQVKAGDFDETRYLRKIVKVESGEGIIGTEKVYRTDNVFKKLDKIHTRGLEEFRAAVELIGSEGFEKLSKESEQIQSGLSNGTLRSEERFLKGNLERLGYDYTISRIFAKLVISERLVRLALSKNMIAERDFKDTVALKKELQGYLNNLDNIQIEENQYSVRIQYAMKFALKVKEAVAGESLLIEDQKPADFKEIDDADDEHDPVKDAFNKNFKNKKASSNKIENEITGLAAGNTEIFEEESNFATPKKRADGCKLGIDSMMKAGQGKLVSLLNTPKYRLGAHGTIKQARPSLGKRDLMYSGDKTEEGFDSSAKHTNIDELELPVDEYHIPASRTIAHSKANAIADRRYQTRQTSGIYNGLTGFKHPKKP
jgi:hypothetical protein